MKEIKIGTSSSKQKYGDRLDTVLIELNEKTKLSGLFTTNDLKAAPVIVCKENINENKKGKKYLVINAGNANAATGSYGLKDCKDINAYLGKEFDCQENQFLPFSTGVIGERLNLPALKKALIKGKKNLGLSNWKEFAEAIMTTDTKIKLIKKTILVKKEKVNIFAVAKGSAMIHPNMATLLSFIFTDLRINNGDLHKIHRTACDQSLNAISVDGDLSTNDSSLLVATGSSLVNFKDNRELLEKEIINTFKELSKKLMLDAEGSSKLISIKIKGLKSNNLCKKMARHISNSLLLKTAFTGGDPNWGRIIMAACNLEDLKINPNNIDLKIGPHKVFTKGELNKNYSEKKGLNEFKKKHINLELNFGKTSSSFEILTCDISSEYIRMNSDYRS
ncbi:MAG: bifunctional glutamate N-acetyltransferase/amino-acid acetyltransferase ArgJ [SAR86 cluster bacterium]|nr:bifunctional glutamate N-acetyltransferase/amino-acid acetyltransferase ArgJ [SAR86 cluster bacterium]